MTQITKIINLTTTSKLAILSFALTFFYLIYLLWFLLHSNETPTTNNKRFGKGEKILLSTPSNRSNNINNNNINSSNSKYTNNNNNSHNNNNNYNNYNNHNTGNATVIFNEFVQSILKKNGYLNTEDILTGLQDKIEHLEHLSIFKDIRNTNKIINTTIICYCQNKSIRIYSELEQFIIKQLANYRQMKDIPIKFEEFGVGNLMKNNFIMKIFNFYSNSNNTTGSNGSNNITITKSMLPIITTSDILQILHEFIMKNHTTTAAYNGKAMDWEALELKFMEYLKALYKPITTTTSTTTSSSSDTV